MSDAVDSALRDVHGTSGWLRRALTSALARESWAVALEDAEKLVAILRAAKKDSGHA